MSHLLVIGGTKGLGRSFVELVAKEHWDASVIARSVPDDQIPSVRYYAADVVDHRGLERAVARAISQGGPLTRLAWFPRYRGDDFAGHIAQVQAAQFLLDYTAPHFDRGCDTSVVLMTSMVTRFACLEQSAGYHAAKCALLGLVRYAAATMRPIRVNGVAAGAVAKGSTTNVPGTATDVARVVRFFLSDASQFVTGQELVVDGGASVVLTP